MALQGGNGHSTPHLRSEQVEQEIAELRNEVRDLSETVRMLQKDLDVLRRLLWK